jgi:hypothetical protein
VSAGAPLNPSRRSEGLYIGGFLAGAIFLGLAAWLLASGTLELRSGTSETAWAVVGFGMVSAAMGAVYIEAMRKARREGWFEKKV